MVWRARWLAPADARRRGLFWLLLFCCLSINTGQSANETDTASDAPPPSSTASPPPSSTASPLSSSTSPIPNVLPPCEWGRHFLCYAYEGLNQPYPEWLQKSDAKCSPCTMDTPCDNTQTITGNEGDARARVAAKCRPQFCKSDDASSIETDCIQALSVNGEKVFFPFNVCTREMVAFGECDGKKLSTKFFVPSSNQLSTEYMVQCDAGFTIPKLVADARDADSSAEAQRQKLTCVPSLQQAAGFLKGDPSPLQNYPYDVSDLLDFKYCEKGGRPHKESTCQPLPLCGKDDETPTPPFEPGAVQAAPDCDLPCHYEYGRMDYSDCVFLDIVDAVAKRSFSAWRGMSGPYAEFMDEEENLMVGAMLNTTDSTPDEENTNPAPVAYRYPKCINATWLSYLDRKRVKRDALLNCKTNIFVQTLGDEGLMIQPPICDGAEDLRICWNRTEPIVISDHASLVPAYFNYLRERIIGCLALVALAIGGALFLRRPSVKLSAVELPVLLKICKDIVLQEQSLFGNWMNGFDSLISQDPDKGVKKKNFHFSIGDNIALQAVQPSVEAVAAYRNAEGIVKKDGESTTKDSAQNDKGAPSSADAAVLARKILTKLADDSPMLVQETYQQTLPAFDSAELLAVFESAIDIVVAQKGVVHLTGPVWIIGDLRGDFPTAWRIFHAYSTMAEPGTKVRYMVQLLDRLDVTRRNARLLFLGDLFDTTDTTMPVVFLVVAAMVLYPKKVFYIAGKCEGRLEESRALDFTTNGTPGTQTEDLGITVGNFFENLPLVATIDGRILAMHGGPTPALTDMTLRDGFDPTEGVHWFLRSRTILNEPHWRVGDYKATEPKKPGVGNRAFYFGEAVVDEVREKLGVDFIIRAQKGLKGGIHFFGDWTISLTSSTSSDPTRPYKNRNGSVLRYDGNGGLNMINFVPIAPFNKGKDELLTKEAFLSSLTRQLKDDPPFMKTIDDVAPNFYVAPNAAQSAAEQ